MKKKLRGRRRWVLPPAIQRGPSESIDRISILTEHADTEGALLWRFARDVELWASTSTEARGRLFSPRAFNNRMSWLEASAFGDPVRPALEVLNRLLSTPGEERKPEQSVAAACFEIAAWARAAGAKETAVGFAQAAALAAPDIPEFALLTGACAEELGQVTRAATWFQLAIALSRRAKDWRTYSLAFIATGAISEADGSTSTAQRAYLRAFRTARRFALKSEYARAAFGLFRLASRAGNGSMASRYATIVGRALLKGTGPGPAAALDLLEFWIEHPQGAPLTRLLTYLSGVEFQTDGERFRAAMLRIRASIAVKELRAAKRAWEDAWTLVAAAPGSRARALLQLARDAAQFGDEIALRQAADAALIHATAEEYEAVRTELSTIAGPDVKLPGGAA